MGKVSARIAHDRRKFLIMEQGGDDGSGDPNQGEKQHAEAESQGESRAHVGSLQIEALHHGGADAEFRENSDDADDHDRGGHKAEIRGRQQSREDNEDHQQRKEVGAVASAIQNRPLKVRLVML